jgi:hypothetical protein
MNVLRFKPGVNLQVCPGRILVKETCHAMIGSDLDLRWFFSPADIHAMNATWVEATAGWWNEIHGHSSWYAITYPAAG